MNPTTIFLSDIDGVLIQPNGYFRAFEDAVNLITGRMGMPGFAPNHYEYSLFEAQGITCEWDMIPLSLAMLFEEYLSAYPTPRTPPTLKTAIEWVREKPVSQRIAYSQYICQLKSLMKVGIAPAEAVLQDILNGSCPDLFPKMSKTDLLIDLLGHTRDFCRCTTSAIFETLVIGSKNFNQSFGCSVGIDTGSYLHKYDQVYINETTNKNLLELKRKGKLGLAAYTARPNLPPIGYSKGKNGFLPEAELAAGLLGWEDIPFIGYGSLTALAREKHTTEETLIKPSPVQALAAYFSAQGMDIWKALVNAWDIYQGGKYPIIDDDEVHIHAFEDARNGLIAVKSMGDLFRSQGITINIHLWGIATNPHKIESLQEVGAVVFPDINQALQKAFTIEGFTE